MNRLVTGADGRQWTLRTELEWRTPATADDFEHDVAGGYVPAAIMLVVMLVFVVVLVVWKPADVIVPYWVLLALLLVVLFFPMRWILRRPWKVVADTQGDPTGEPPAEHWVGTVRGMFAVRGEVARVKRAIEQVSLPDFDGALKPVE